jgi:hypothetical protein
MARKATKNVGANNHSPDYAKANILKIVPKRKSVDIKEMDNLEFMVVWLDQLERRIKKMEYFAETVALSMSTQHANLTAFNGTLKKVYPEWKQAF